MPALKRKRSLEVDSGSEYDIEPQTDSDHSDEEYKEPPLNKRAKTTKTTSVAPATAGPSQPPSQAPVLSTPLSGSAHPPANLPVDTWTGFAPQSKKMVDYTKAPRVARPWFFGHHSPNGYGIYALKCPKRTCTSFKVHPLKNNVAVDHLTNCNQPFTDEDDIVRRYATQGKFLPLRTAACWIIY